MSDALPTRDPIETARTLEEWLTRQLGASSVIVSDLSIPKAGFSNETIIGHAAWSTAAGERTEDHTIEFVLRIEPTAHQLFAEPDAMRQARVMSTLAGHVPVPRLWLTEPDRSVLGAPFFLMERIHGRIPGDVPCWHQKGWTTSLSEDERAQLHDNALGSLVDLHAVDTSGGGFDWLESHGEGTALQRYVSHLSTWADWCRPVIRYDVDTIDAALAYVIAETPSDDRRSVMWGDARVGNIIFADDLTVAAMLDWEGASLGPPELDVAWWVMFDEFLCETQGLTRLAGVPDRRGTFERYEALGGAPLREIVYYEVLAGLQLALINSRLADLLISTGKVPEEMGAGFVTRVTAMIRRDLARATGA
jgi:aminoglycoside phosphotransferase (APT) family kinase protein